MNTIRFTFDAKNSKESLESFNELLKCMQNPHFDSAYIKYDSEVGTANPEFPLLLMSHATNREVQVAGIAIGPRRNIAEEHIHPYLSSATIEILRLAGFKMGEAIQNMILLEPKLHVTIWND